MFASRFISKIHIFFPAMVSGFLLTTSFPDADFSFLAFFALIPWLISMADLDLRQTFASGFIMGLVHYLTLIYWIVPTVHIYGGLHFILACSVLLLLCAYLALYPAIFAVVAKKTFRTSTFSPFWAACLWTSLEYIRTHLLTGFPWGALGYSQHSNLMMIQIIDISGVLGLSFLIVLVNYCLFAAFKMMRSNRPQKALTNTLIPVLAVSAVMLYGKHKIEYFSHRIDQAPPARLGIVQGNIEQDKKWTREFKETTIEKYNHLSKSIFEQKPDLVIWPETALPFYYGVDHDLSERVNRTIRDSKTNFLIGSPAFERKKENIAYFNRVFMINRFSIATSVYDKNHLVPFGEYVPFAEYLTFLGKITAQAGNFSAGEPLFEPLKYKDQSTGVLICFEILFPSISARFVQNGADILTTVTNDAWFGTTSAASQHFSIAVFRAVENRRSLARAANTGISGFINPVGQIFDTTPLFTDQAIIREMPVLDTLTFYTRHPHLFNLFCLIAICFNFMVKGLINKFRRKTHERRT